MRFQIERDDHVLVSLTRPDVDTVSVDWSLHEIWVTSGGITQLIYRPVDGFIMRNGDEIRMDGPSVALIEGEVAMTGPSVGLTQDEIDRFTRGPCRAMERSLKGRLAGMLIIGLLAGVGVVAVAAFMWWLVKQFHD